MFFQTYPHYNFEYHRDLLKVDFSNFFSWRKLFLNFLIIGCGIIVITTNFKNCSCYIRTIISWVSIREVKSFVPDIVIKWFNVVSSLWFDNHLGNFFFIVTNSNITFVLLCWNIKIVIFRIGYNNIKKNLIVLLCSRSPIEFSFNCMKYCFYQEIIHLLDW